MSDSQSEPDSKALLKKEVKLLSISGIDAEGLVEPKLAFAEESEGKIASASDPASGVWPPIDTLTMVAGVSDGGMMLDLAWTTLENIWRSLLAYSPSSSTCHSSGVTVPLSCFILSVLVSFNKCQNCRKKYACPHDDDDRRLCVTLGKGSFLTIHCMVANNQRVVASNANNSNQHLSWPPATRL